MTRKGDLSSFRALVRGSDIFLAKQEVAARLESGALLRGEKDGKEGPKNREGGRGEAGGKERK